MQSSMEIIARAQYAELTHLDVANYVPLTLPGDVLVIADVKPESSSDLPSPGRARTFALVTKIEGDNRDNSSSTSFKVTTLKDFRSKDDTKKSLYVIHLTSLITNRRLWNALHMTRNLKIINKVLYIYFV
ncbi:hypothetical protein V6N13_105459 [Hibiscus sabdariffa]